MLRLTVVISFFSLKSFSIRTSDSAAALTMLATSSLLLIIHVFVPASLLTFCSEMSRLSAPRSRNVYFERAVLALIKITDSWLKLHNNFNVNSSGCAIRCCIKSLAITLSPNTRAQQRYLHNARRLKVRGILNIPTRHIR